MTDHDSTQPGEVVTDQKEAAFRLRTQARH